MIIIPAIDIKDGKCVRLIQGKMDQETVFSDSPSNMAKKWENDGAGMIHIVDLNGAVEGLPKNLKYIEEIISSINVPIQVGGGIRTMETVDAYISAGVERVILGTSAVADPELVKDLCRKYPEKIIIGIDAKNGYVAVKGWTEATELKAYDFAKKFDGLKLAGIIYTDISKDGMMQGPNIESTKEMAMSVNVPIIASGGISSLQDIKNIIQLEEYGVSGVITGRALYNGAFSLQEALELVEC